MAHGQMLIAMTLAWTISRISCSDQLLHWLLNWQKINSRKIPESQLTATSCLCPLESLFWVHNFPLWTADLFGQHRKQQVSNCQLSLVAGAWAKIVLTWHGVTSASVKILPFDQHVHHPKTVAECLFRILLTVSTLTMKSSSILLLIWLLMRVFCVGMNWMETESMKDCPCALQQIGN